MKIHSIITILFAFLLCFLHEVVLAQDAGDSPNQCLKFQKIKLNNLLKEGKIPEARNYLLAWADDGDWLAQKILLESYLGEKNLYGIDFNRISGYYASQCELGDDSKYAEKLKIDKNLDAALKLLKHSLNERNFYAGVIYAIMLKNGVHFSRDEQKAKAFLSEISSQSEYADFYYSLFYEPIEMEENKFNPDLSCLIKEKDSPYTFKPVESQEWASLCMVRDVSGNEFTYLSSVKNEMYKPKGNKKLVPIPAIIDLAGTSEKRDIFRVFLDGNYEFKVNDKVYVTENSQSIVQKEGDSDFPIYRSFDCSYLGSLDCGIQILEIYNNCGGSGSERNFCFWGIVKEKNDKIQQLAIRHYGECFYFASAREFFYDNFYVIDNVFARFTIGADLMASGQSRPGKAKLRIYSFEKDPKKYEKTKLKLLNLIRGTKLISDVR